MKQPLPLLIPLLLLAPAGCVSLGPVPDKTETAILVLAEKKDPPAYPAPVFNVALPSYLNQSTVWYATEEGRLRTVPGWIWAESLSPALRRELALALGRSDPYPGDARIDLTLSRFILLDDGSAVAVAEGSYSSGDETRALPVIRIRLASAWDPSAPASFLGGYRALLEATAARLSASLDDSVKKE
ncbi:MAG: ABC-type transport auxiliary lipoprotein family protein [Puniceicoccaceae bacterium]